MTGRATAFLALAGLIGCRALPPGAGDPYAIPYEALSEKQQDRVHKVMDAPTVMVDLERTPVRSLPDVYVFLMDELPFTAGVLQELRESKYEISRDGDHYLFDDHDGLKIRAELVRREDARWLWYTYGTYDLGLFRAIGRSVIIVRYDRDGDTLATEARVYAKVENKTLEAGALALKGAVEGVIRDKSFVFIKASKMVAEMVTRDPAKLYEAVKGSEHVDAAVLEEFRKRFVP